jgi:predicted nucleotidyltransferase
MYPQPDVINILADHIGRYPHVEKVVLFGSRARGDQRERSDIDIAVIGPEMTDEEWTDIWTYVDEEAPTLLCVDLVRWKEASDEIRRSIEREGVVLYERH